MTPRPSRTPARVALVGYGYGGSLFHAPFIAAEPRLELATVVTADSERRAEVVRRHPGTALLSGVDDLLARVGDFDLVVVSSPNSSHVAIAEAVLASGCPVVVDKPVAPTAAEVRHLGTQARYADTMVVPFHNRRWDGDFRTVSALVDAGDLGILHTFESRFERWQPSVSSGPERSWKRDPTPGAGAGILFDLGTHLIDQAVALFGRPESVYAELAIRRVGALVDDDDFISLSYSDGRRVHLWASAVAATRGPRFRLLGSDAGYVKYGMDGQEAALLAGAIPTGPGWGEEPPTSWGHLDTGSGPREIATLPGAYQMFYEAMAACVLDGAPAPVDLDDAILTAEIVEAGYLSSATHATVPLPNKA